MSSGLKLANLNPNCLVCLAIKERKSIIAYEDDEVIALIDENPAALGHMPVMPISHYPIIEQVPDYVIDKVFQAANRLSIAIFEAMQVQGTNILVANGVAAGQDLPHFMVNIIPRTEGDKLNFAWQPKQLSEEEMSTVELMLKEAALSVGSFEKRQEDIIDLDAGNHKGHDHDQTHDAQDTSPSDHAESQEPEEDYMIKQLRRIA